MNKFDFVLFYGLTLVLIAAGVFAEETVVSTIFLVMGAMVWCVMLIVYRLDKILSKLERIRILERINKLQKETKEVDNENL